MNKKLFSLVILSILLPTIVVLGAVSYVRSPAGDRLASPIVSYGIIFDQGDVPTMCAGTANYWAFQVKNDQYIGNFCGPNCFQSESYPVNQTSANFSLKLAKGVYDSWTINFSTEPIPNSVAYPAGICGWINGSDHFIIGKR